MHRCQFICITMFEHVKHFARRLFLTEKIYWRIILKLNKEQNFVTAFQTEDVIF